MKITDIEIRACRHNDPVMKDSEMRDGKKSELEFLVITFHTDEGLSTSTLVLQEEERQWLEKLPIVFLNHFLLDGILCIERSTGMSTEWQIDGGIMHLDIVMVLLI